MNVSHAKPLFSTRRRFMQCSAGLVAGSLAAACSEQGGTGERSVVEHTTPSERGRGIREIRLQTSRLAAVRPFYRDVLQLPIVEDRKDSLAVAAGTTRITFVEVGAGEPYYHFAFNIPENKLAASMEWLRPRTPILKRPDGSEVYHFQSWNAHSVYFNDPAGNILEFIARHSLPTAAEGAFSSAEILYASEIAIVVEDVAATVARARPALGLGVFANSVSDQFAALGTDERLLLVIKRGRAWNSGHGRAAETWPVEAALWAEGDTRAREPLESAAEQYRVSSL